MRVVLSPEAAERLEAQIGYLHAQGASRAADNLRLRVMQFLSQYIADYPRTGRYLAERELWETWLPGTRLVVWYRIEVDHIAIATLWHAAQDRNQGTT